MGHSAVHEYLQTLRRWYKVKRREAPPSQPTCSSGALWSVGCFGCANSRLSSVIAQKQMCAKYRTLPVHEHLQTLRRWYKVKRREAPPAQPTCSSGALRSVGCFGCANSRLSSVIAQKQMCAKYRTLPRAVIVV